MDINTFKETFHLQLDSDKPLYRQLYETFKRNIYSGVLKEGDRMLPEITICETLNISRSTIRKTMEMLIEEGLVTRRRGKGSFITKPKLKRNINYLYNFSENMRSLSVTPSSVVLRCEVLAEAPLLVQEAMKPDKNSKKVFRLKRIRLANGDPMLCEDVYVPYHLCPGIEQYDFSAGSLYDILSEKYLQKPEHATESIEAIFLSEEDKKLLQCEQDVPGFRITRVSENENGEIMEYTTSVTRADKCVFLMELSKGSGHAKEAPVQIQRSLDV